MIDINQINRDLYCRVFQSNSALANYRPSRKTLEGVHIFRNHLRELFLRENPKPMHMQIPSVSLRVRQRKASASDTLRAALSGERSLSSPSSSKAPSTSFTRARRGSGSSVKRESRSDDTLSYQGSETSSTLRALIAAAELKMVEDFVSL